eukprot:scaffold206478_cov33-Tisochrysis_lutea.AAC.6
MSLPRKANSSEKAPVRTTCKKVNNVSSTESQLMLGVSSLIKCFVEHLPSSCWLREVAALHSFVNIRLRKH